MNKVTSEFSVGKYKVLVLDKKKPDSTYNKYSIEGIEYDIVPIFDSPNSIAIESNDSFIGKVVKYID